MNVIPKDTEKLSMKKGKMLAKTEVPMIARTIIEAPVITVTDDMTVLSIVVGIILSIGAEMVS